MHQAIERAPDLAAAQILYNTSLIVEAENNTYTYIMAAHELDEPEDLKTAYNNPNEAKQFVNNITGLTDTFMADIRCYNRYCQEEAYPEFVMKYMKELKQLDNYFDTTDPSLVLDLIDDKLCKLIRKQEPSPSCIKSWTSEEKIPNSHGILQALAHESPTPALSDTGQAVVIQLFAHLQFAHKNLVKVAKSIAQLGQVSTPEQFGFILRRSVQPLIQLQIPPYLASPANWSFEKEWLTPEESLEELGLNQMLPQPFHPKLSVLDEKHPTRCVAAGIHFLIQRAAFQSKISQSKVAEKFLVHQKKMHLAISGCKYDLGWKPTKKEKVERSVVPDSSTTPQTKVTKKDQPREQPMEQDIPKTTEIADPDSDSDLPDPFTNPLDKTIDPAKGKDASQSETRKPKTSGTKEDKDADKALTEMDTSNMPEHLSDDEEGTPKKFTLRKPPR